MRPNLFSFATSELSQDAFLCWLLSWADCKYISTNVALHRVGIQLLNLIYSKAGVQPPTQFSSVEILKQKAGIDILCIVNEDTVVLIEDKVGTKQHSDQLARYKDYVSKTWSAIDKIILIYLQTGDQSDYSEVKKHGYIVFGRNDALKILESQEGAAANQGSDICSDFSSYLREIENDVQSYAALPFAKWSWNSWKGFYTRLQEELNHGDWDYVPNPSGGFLGFWWHFRGDPHCEQYLQLEMEKFCFKIWVADKSKRAELRNFWHSKLIKESHVHGLKLKRPDRFGNGEYMTVAVLAQEYRSTNAQGVLDLCETCTLIRKAEALLDALDLSA